MKLFTEPSIAEIQRNQTEMEKVAFYVRSIQDNSYFLGTYKEDDDDRSLVKIEFARKFDTRRSAERGIEIYLREEHGAVHNIPYWADLYEVVWTTEPYRREMTY